VSADVVLRAATPADVPTMLALLEAAHLPAMELEDHLENFVVAAAGGRVVGCGGLETYDGCDAGLVRSMVIDEPLRSSGLGARILTWVLERARVKGIKRLFLFTVDAAPFYERFGFLRVTLDDFPACARGSGQYRAVERFGAQWGVIAMARPLDR
jgi:N-acetylglutamate synthase-like GNAT family acetyltransferase